MARSPRPTRGAPTERGGRRAGWRRWAAFLPAVTYAVVVFYFGTRPSGPAVLGQANLDKLAHFSAYAVLGALLGWGWLRAGRRPAAALLVGAALLQGMVEELLQVRIPGRHGDPLDWLADALGAVTGFALVVRLVGGGFGKGTE